MIGNGFMRDCRARYLEAFGTEWPHENRFLATLIEETKRDLGLRPNGKPEAVGLRNQLRANILSIMHENS